MKKTIKLTESDLHNIIKESVNNILSELDWRTYDSAAQKADKLSDRKDIDEFERERRKRQSSKFRHAASDARRKQYNLSPAAYGKALGAREYKTYNPEDNELRRMSQLYQDFNNCLDGNCEYKDGKWINKKHYK